MMKKYSLVMIGLLLVCGFNLLDAQGFLRTKGDSIVTATGENFLIRSIGTGNWMITEGYMMKTYVNGGTHTGLRDRLVQDIGLARTDSFYTAWLNNHVTKADIDSMAKWGFNSIRPALHYRWFTLPIEEEPVAGGQTWLETGFSLIDSLVKWCSENEMYIILDMHGAPGGQGEDRAISDYDPAKPSLWESEENKTKLVELWGKIAERYADEEWIGGYDLINEPNWNLPNGTALRQLYERITEKIRSVDTNHILFIEGNWFANDFNGLTPPWDDNMAYSFHKYWSVNDEGSLEYGTWLRDSYNVPVWLGETGENSNTWFTNLISLCERKNVGWSFWPIKKGGLNNVMRVEFNEDYFDVVDYWDGGASMSEDEIFQAMMTLAERHKIENCIIQYDVIDAMTRQPYTNELKPFTIFEPGDNIYASDYAYGRNGYAYRDNDTANQASTTGEYNAWNTGWEYRNDGVDIQLCEDTQESNGYNVGWTNDGEWMIYHIRTDSAMMVDAEFRTASGSSSGGTLVLEANGKIITGPVNLPGTGGWQSWSTTSYQDCLLPAGLSTIKIRIVKGGSNLSYFKLTNPRSPDEAQFTSLFAETSVLGNTIFVHLNDTVSAESAQVSDFTMKIGNRDVEIRSVNVDVGSAILEIEPAEIMPYNVSMYISYAGNSIISGERVLEEFSNLKVYSNLFKFPTLPVKIEAEDFYTNNGYSLEDCSDAGGGKNTAYANNGDYLDYLLYVNESAEFQIDMRVALQNGSALVQFLVENEEGGYIVLKSMALANTGGWQDWETQSTTLTMPEGKYRFRIKSISSGEYNLNWFQFRDPVGVRQTEIGNTPVIYPNPANDHVFIEYQIDPDARTYGRAEFYDTAGRLLIAEPISAQRTKVSTGALQSGVYYLRIVNPKGSSTHKLLIR